MLVQMQKNFKAVAKGDFVKADESKGEFILDTSNPDQFTFATLSEIANKNKFQIKKANKSDVMEQMEVNLNKLKLREQNVMSETNTVLEIVKAGIEKGLSDDDMLIQIVQSGIKFKSAGKLFRNVMEENGFRISAAKRTEAINGILEEAEFAAETYQEVQDMIERLVNGDAENNLEAVPDTSTVQAIRAIKKYLKELEIPYPKAPRKPKGGLRQRFMDLVIANPAITLAELEDFLSENTKEEKVETYLKKFTPLMHFAQAVGKAVSENEVDMSGVELPEKEAEGDSDEETESE